MKTYTIDDILNHKEFTTSLQKIKDIEGRIEGRIMSTPNKCIHVIYLLAKLLGSKLKTYVELGVLHGGSMSLVKMAMSRKKSAKIIGVDMFDGFDLRFHIDPVSKVEITNQVVSRNLHYFGKDNVDIRLVKGDAAAKKTVEAVENQLEGEKISLLFIDCDFKKENVITMFKEYGKLVSSGGIIVFGNYRRKEYPGVERAIEELSFRGWKTVGVYKMYYIVQKKGIQGRPAGRKTARSLYEKIERENEKKKNKAKK